MGYITNKFNAVYIKKDHFQIKTIQFGMLHENRHSFNGSRSYMVNHLILYMWANPSETQTFRTTLVVMHRHPVFIE